jgi:hypothetical protein
MTEEKRIEQQAKLKNLELQWQDHFHVRNQTWKALWISCFFFVVLLGVDWMLNIPSITYVSSIFIALTAISGIQITVRHRNMSELVKFKTISQIEKELGIITDHKAPVPLKWWHLFFLSRFNSSLYILRIHFFIFVLSILNLILHLSII